MENWNGEQFLQLPESGTVGMFRGKELACKTPLFL
jgi:hypothetical protein